MTSNEPPKQTLGELVDRVLNEKEKWSKHLAHTCCRCEKCTCGKHLCKYQPLKINLKPVNTTYRDQYPRKQARISNQKLEIPYQSYNPRQLVNKSEYRDQYYRKKAKRQKVRKAQKKADTLEVGGPNFAGTTYQDSYKPMYLAPPQKIKNPENIAKSQSKMNTKSNYRDSYNWNQRANNPRQQPIKYKDNIKPSPPGVVYGGSSYDHDYLKYKNVPNNESFAPQQKYTPTHGLRPKSSYRCDYTSKRVQPCPALKCPAEQCC